jgi:hypothetical protein
MPQRLVPPSRRPGAGGAPLSIPLAALRRGLGGKLRARREQHDLVSRRLSMDFDMASSPGVGGNHRRPRRKPRRYVTSRDNCRWQSRRSADPGASGPYYRAVALGAPSSAIFAKLGQPSLGKLAGLLWAVRAAPLLPPSRDWGGPHLEWRGVLGPCAMASSADECWRLSGDCGRWAARVATTPHASFAEPRGVASATRAVQSGRSRGTIFARRREPRDEERAHRKRRLIKGPREFRDVRSDQPKKRG